ncbi:MAG: metallophosphoesterase [Prolixibacteraceae bacterium]|nr:metallophosphoesterase [Prolixibacteraceae bacterium]
MNKLRIITFKILFVTLSAIFSTGISSGGNSIVSPWRAMKTIVKAGDSFPILYDNLTSSEINKVTLRASFNNVDLTIDSVRIGFFEYDSFTHSAANNKIWVTVPSDAAEELYDLLVESDGGTVISKKSVKVVKEFSQTQRFIHISDLHISRQWVGTSEDGYAKELELFDRFTEVANIISPDFVIVTGDIIHHYSRLNADSTGWGGDKLYDANQRPLVEEKFRNYYDGAKGLKGIHGLNAPVFSLPGNHDSYGVSRKDHLAMASQWNKMCGKRVYAFSYGDTRILAADDFLGDPVVDIPDESPMSGLQGELFKNFFKKEGLGKVRIMAQHRPDRIDTAFIDKYKINVLLNGHHHDPFFEYVGKTPTLSIRPGTVCRSGDILEWEKTLGFFRIFTVDGDEISFSPPLRFCKNPTKPYEDLELNLTLDFTNPNDGTSTTNEAVIKNLFEIDLPECKVRFVMKKGKYRVEGGEIKQIIETDKITVVDVWVDVGSNSKKQVKIYKSQI